MPFLAEELYQNLVRTVDEGAPESVHLARWPLVMPEFIDEGLNRDMTLVIRLVSIGHAARQKANRKVRQPLAEAAFSVGNPSERKALEGFADIVADELNVKQVRLLDSSTEALSHHVKPLPKQLGQKYGNKFPAIQKALLSKDPEDLARMLLSGQAVTVQAEGMEYTIMPEEVEVKALAKEGFAVAEEGAYVAALVTELTPELIREGLAREFVRRVQDLRKSADLDVSDRIRLYVEVSPNLRSALDEYREYVTAETLTSELIFTAPPEDAAIAEDAFDGESLKAGLSKV
jgi:isoleucyl-tRNA synthetase